MFPESGITGSETFHLVVNGNEVKLGLFKFVDIYIYVCMCIFYLHIRATLFIVSGHIFIRIECMVDQETDKRPIIVEFDNCVVYFEH